MYISQSTLYIHVGLSLICITHVPSFLLLPLSLTGGRITIISIPSGSTIRSTLVLDPVLPEDSGAYKCIAETAYTSSFAMTTIEVQCEYL